MATILNLCLKRDPNNTGFMRLKGVNRRILKKKWQYVYSQNNTRYSYDRDDSINSGDINNTYGNDARLELF